MKGSRTPIQWRAMPSPVRDYFRNIYRAVKTTGVGMFITLRQLKEKSVTLQYPSERWKLPTGYRGMLFNDVDDCIVCNQCADICPAECILIEGDRAAKNEDLGACSDGTKKKIKLKKFDIELNHCLWCGLCTEVCPTECLVMTEEYEFSSYRREGLYMNYIPDGWRPVKGILPEPPPVPAAPVEPGKNAPSAPEKAASK